MSETTSLKVEIGGHTDSIGDPIKNIEISVKRAKTVKNYLVKLGIAPERLIIQGYGSRNPIADNKTEDGRALNRRVEIIPLKE
jgi:outer membrane protein OmpA-like peptidoglycan-associated protein